MSVPMDVKQILPMIHENLCTGCGACVQVCSTGALRLVQKHAVIVAPDECSYCADCEEICPYHAIAVPFEIIYAEIS